MKKQAITLALIFIATLAIALMLLYREHPQPQGYEMVTSYSDGAYFYSCSKPIKAKKVKGRAPFTGEEVDNYVPVDIAEAKLFCYSSGAIENEGKITILQKPEVKSLIDRYEYREVSVKALEFEYIEDKEFVHRLLPDYTDQEIGCIIIVETPNEKLVFLEDEHLEAFEELDYKVFDQYLANVSEEDRKLFLQNLQ